MKIFGLEIIKKNEILPPEMLEATIQERINLVKEGIAEELDQALYETDGTDLRIRISAIITSIKLKQIKFRGEYEDCN